jgi:protocatechuate 3,4-dioxygenase beta subunit
MTSDSHDRSPGGISRRRVLQQAGALGLAATVGGAVVGRQVLVPDAAEAAASAAAGLTLTPEQEEGPFYVALEKVRRTITLGRPGVPLHLRIKVVTTAGRLVTNAACDIWQCDALGVYSDESSQSTAGQTWLRGVQLTGSDGIAEFVTIYPGHYQGRTTHIHVKVHVGGHTSAKAYHSGHVSHTGQLLFDDAVTTRVYRLAPYTSDTAVRVLNGSDQVYVGQGGSKSRLKLQPLGSQVADGYLATITLVVDPTATPAGVGVGGR